VQPTQTSIDLRGAEWLTYRVSDLWKPLINDGQRAEVAGTTGASGRLADRGNIRQAPMPMLDPAWEVVRFLLIVGVLAVAVVVWRRRSGRL